MLKIKTWIINFRNFIITIKENKSQSLVIAGLLFTLTTVAGNLISKASDALFPTKDDSVKIIENQNRQFDLLKENLQKLQSSIAGKDRTYLNVVTDTIKDLKTESDNLVVRISALQAENKSLKSTLKSTKGIYGGVDIMVPNKSGFKIDSQTTFGYSELGSGYGEVSLTTISANENVRSKALGPGNGLYFTNENGKRCFLVFNGNTKVLGSSSVVGNFVVGCKM